MIITNRNNLQAILSTFTFVVMAAIWMMFAPLQVGGQSAYIVVVGISMEPKFHLGDLVIVQPNTHYAIGDIVAYKNADLQSNVIHRIIDIQNNHYILKGDNNFWIDRYQPTAEELIGKLWIHIPGGGSMIQRLRLPLNTALIAGALAGFLMIGFLNDKRKGRKRMNNKSWLESIRGFIKRLKPTSAPQPEADSNQATLLLSNLIPLKAKLPELNGSISESLFFSLGLIAFASFILGLISFTRPVTVSMPTDVSYQNIGLFSYSATVPSGVYDANILQTGQPIFPKLSCAALFNFHYALIGNALKDIAGSYQINAQIIEPQTGWQRTLTLLPNTIFTGNSFDASTKVNFCEIAKLTESLETQTDIHPSQYTLLITPDITVSGTIAGWDLQEAKYRPQLTFRYDRLNFAVVQADPTTNPFNQTQTGYIQEARQKANTISLFGWQPAVLTLRWLSSIGFMLSLLGLWMLTNSIQAMTNHNPESAVRMRYSSMLIEIRNSELNQSSRIIDVQSMDDLAKLAERYNTMILHENQNDQHTYFANADGTTYRFAMKMSTNLVSDDQSPTEAQHD